MRKTAPRLAAVAALSLALTACGAGAAVVGVHDIPTQITTTAPLTRQSAQQIAGRVMGQADNAKVAPAAQAQRLRSAALTGAALAVANAASRLGADQQPTTDALTRTEAPKVLAISRGSSWPRVILAQTTSGDGAAVLNLLSSPDAGTPFRLASSATMHPGAAVAALDSVSKGSPLLTDGTGLALSPDALVKEYAASLAYPQPAKAANIDESDPFSMSVRANAAAQARSFGTLAALTQKHVVHPDQTVTIALKGGGALVFALFDRTDTITLKPGGKSLTPSAEFQRLVRKKALAKKAELKSYESVVFTIPPEGRASVVAADEVLYSAQGA